nr:integrase, catalytic region, zinc finger, CCHC-type, peptidase aspartic, catalytic [Tanacetum cinerariifolium]
MSTQQDIYAAGFENRPPMFNKENYVPWSSRLLQYAKSRPNRKLIHNSILNGPYVRKMIPEPGDENREITQMMKGPDIGIQEKKAKLFNEWERFTSNEGESIESYYHRFLKLMNDLKRNKHFPEKIASNLKFLNNLQPEWSRHYNEKEVDELKAERLAKTQDPLALMANSNNPYAFPAPHQGNGGNQFRQYAGNPAGYNDVIGNQNPIENGNLVAVRAEGNAAKQNRNQIRCYNCRGVGIQLQEEEYDLMAAAADLDEIKEVNANCILMANLQQASTLGTQTDSAPVNDTDGSAEEAAKFVGDFKSLGNEVDASLAKHKALELEIKRLLKAVVNQDIMIIVQSASVDDTSDLQTELERTKESFENYIIKKESEYAKLWNDWYKKYDACKYEKFLYDKAYKDMKQNIERLQAQLGDLKGKSKETSCVSDTQNPLSQKLENENVELEFQVLNYARENAHLKATYKNLFNSISVLRTQTKTIIASLQNELQSTIYKNAKLRTQLFKKVSDQKDNTQDTSENTKFAKQPIVEKIFPKLVIAPGMFRINPSKTSREEKHVPNTVSASNKAKPITVSQPPVITKKDVNSDLNGLSSIGVDNTKTRRPQPRSNTKHDRVPSTSKNSQSKNKEAEVEKHHRNLLLSKNNKHISSACNNIKIDSQDVISKVVCAMCNKCLISVNHDKCLRNYVNGKNSHGKKQKAKVSFKENRMKYLPKVAKTKKVESHKSLATPKPRKSRLLLRWSPTGRLFDQEGKIDDSSESESQSDCSNGYSDLFMKFMGTVRFGNDHVAAILGFGDLQWGNILISRVYFVEGLGHNLFSIGQFCDSDLEVAFRRNACFVKNLEGVDLLKGDRST